jgi:hypothetical protein
VEQGGGKMGEGREWDDERVEESWLIRVDRIKGGVYGLIDEDNGLFEGLDWISTSQHSRRGTG